MCRELRIPPYSLLVLKEFYLLKFSNQLLTSDVSWINSAKLCSVTSADSLLEAHG